MLWLALVGDEDVVGRQRVAKRTGLAKFDWGWLSLRSKGRKRCLRRRRRCGRGLAPRWRNNGR